MIATQAVVLEHRGIIVAEGADTRSFLQGLVSNDVNRVDPERAIWSAFLTPQGKFLHEFFVAEQQGALLLDAEAERLPDLLRRLSLYRLRSKVTLTDRRDADLVVALFGDAALQKLGLSTEPGQAKPFGGGVAFCDPRLAALGARAILPREGAEKALSAAGFGSGSLADYDRLRLSLGVPDGSRDLEIEKSILLEAGFEELNGLDWNKGCYMGQELTARTKYRALIKKRLLPVAIDGPAPEPGTAVLRDGREVGTLRSSSGDLGLALMRLDSLESEGQPPFTAGEARLTPEKPDWANF